MRLRLFPLILIAVLFAPVVASASGISRVGKRQGCEIAEERIQIYIYREIKTKRFEKNLPYRAALMPLSFTIGFAMNYIGQLTYVLPLFAPTGFSLKGNEFGALMLENAFTYSPLKGGRLDDVDDAVIAFANYDVGMCYYREENYLQASAFFEMLSETRYSQYIGKDDLHFLLGDCYYRLNILDQSVQNYRSFLIYAKKRDDRREFVEGRIKTIEAANKKGLWGFEIEQSP